MSADPSAPGAVNEHYLDHVVATGRTRGVEAVEDIVTGNGIKLIAKGARIDDATRDRLLQHKLRKPLEQSVQVTGALGGEQLGECAQSLLGRLPLLRALCEHGGGRAVPESIAALPLAPALRSLLTVYAESQPERLAHTVGVAMLALALARRMLPRDVERQRTLATAGLLHDIGELYIDPQCLTRGVQLSPQQWRHIVAHPLLGHRVLSEMAGAGAEVADAVLLHHERLDGFGYPNGVGGDRFTLGGQIVAVAEWLMGLLDSGQAPLARAGMAPRLVPGEFNPALLQVVATAARASKDAAAEEQAAGIGDDLLAGIESVAATLERFRASQGWLDERIAEAPPALRRVLEAERRRLQRMQASFSSTGFDAQPPALLLAELQALADPRVDLELATLVRELQWRMREVERESRLRAGLLPEAERAVVEAFIERVNGTAASPPGG